MVYFPCMVFLNVLLDLVVRLHMVSQFDFAILEVVVV